MVKAVSEFRTSEIPIIIIFVVVTTEIIDAKSILFQI